MKTFLGRGIDAGSVRWLAVASLALSGAQTFGQANVSTNSPEVGDEVFTLTAPSIPGSTSWLLSLSSTVGSGFDLFFGLPGAVAKAYPITSVSPVNFQSTVVFPQGGQYIYGGSFVLSSPVTPVVYNVTDPATSTPESIALALSGVTLAITGSPSGYTGILSATATLTGNLLPSGLVGKSVPIQYNLFAPNVQNGDVQFGSNLINARPQPEPFTLALSAMSVGLYVRRRVRRASVSGLGIRE